jgi:hypothetical protein
MSIRRMKKKNGAARERAKSKESGRTYPAPSFGVSSGFTSSIRFCVEAATSADRGIGEDAADALVLERVVGGRPMHDGTVPRWH